MHVCHAGSKTVNAHEFIFRRFASEAAVLMVTSHMSTRANGAIAEICLATGTRVAPSETLGALWGGVLIDPW